MNLQNKTILVTGASAGIGNGLAIKLDQEKAKLILIARSEDKLKEFIEKYGSQHRYFVCDLSNINQVLDLINIIKQQYDHIDVLINVAGIGVYKDISHVTVMDWQQSLAINVTAPYILTQGLLPLMSEISQSLVLNIGSGAGTIPMADRSVYCTTKFALRGWTLSLAEEFKDKNPDFCLITLGSTLTSFGEKSIDEKLQKQKQGTKSYFPVSWLADKLSEIIKDDNRQTETTLFPSHYKNEFTPGVI